MHLAALQHLASTSINASRTLRRDAASFYFILLGAAVIVVLAVLPFACEGPLRRWNKNRGRLE